jgi:tRNA pseudouridine38-40 synthase
MPSFRITVAYDGTDFVGWQRQAAGVSIQGVLEDALRELDERDVTVVGAGRTDAGVHALAQVAAFALERARPADAIVRALNARLPETVRVLAAEEVPPSFHPQFDARAKRYRYRIWNGDVLPPFERLYAWHVPGALDVGAMERAARVLEGEHDFAAFRSTGSDVETTVRRIFSSGLRTADCGPRFDYGFPAIDSQSTIRNESANRNPQSAVLEYDIAGNGFLRHMVRAIVGSLVEVGRGRRPPDWIASVLQSRERGCAGRSAPARGLFLVGIDYDVHSGFTTKDS